jgi:hypothetical protein
MLALVEIKVFMLVMALLMLIHFISILAYGYSLVIL